MDNRPNHIARAMMRAELESMWSTCQRLAVGTCIFTTSWDFILGVYNGAPRDVKHCNEQPQLTDRCPYCIHSEKNAINLAAKLGIRLAGTNMVTLYRPCISCANDIVQANIGGLYYRHDYDTDGQKDYVLYMLQNTMAYVQQVEPSFQEQVFSAILANWKETWKDGVHLMPSDFG